MPTNQSPLPVVALDLKTFSRQAAGVGRYCIELTQNLVRRKAFDYRGLSAPQTDLSLLPPAAEFPLLRGPYDQVKSSVARSFWALPRGLGQHQVDLTHCLDPLLTSYMSPRYKQVSTVHDMIVWKYPSVFTKKHVFMVRQFTRMTLAKSDHIITDSHSAKQDILEQFPQTNPEKITVIHLAASGDYRPQAVDLVEQFRTKHQLPKRYFLSVGTQEPRKNRARMIQAFKEMKKQSAFDDVGLALVGGKGWLQGDEDPEQLRRRGIFPLGFLPEEELPLAYAGALAFVYPSLYEGFGLPLLESMGCGTPVITSNNSSLPEVAGEAGLYVDPLSVESISSALVQLADQPELHQRLKEASLTQAQAFSWDTTAAQTEAVYRQVLGL